LTAKPKRLQGVYSPTGTSSIKVHQNGFKTNAIIQGYYGKSAVRLLVESEL